MIMRLGPTGITCAILATTILVHSQPSPFGGPHHGHGHGQTAPIPPALIDPLAGGAGIDQRPHSEPGGGGGGGEGQPVAADSHGHLVDTHGHIVDTQGHAVDANGLLVADASHAGIMELPRPRPRGPGPTRWGGGRGRWGRWGRWGRRRFGRRRGFGRGGLDRSTGFDRGWPVREGGFTTRGSGRPVAMDSHGHLLDTHGHTVTPEGNPIDANGNVRIDPSHTGIVEPPGPVDPGRPGWGGAGDPSRPGWGGAWDPSRPGWGGQPVAMDSHGHLLDTHGHIVTPEGNPIDANGNVRIDPSHSGMVEPPGPGWGGGGRRSGGGGVCPSPGSMSMQVCGPGLMGGRCTADRDCGRGMKCCWTNCPPGEVQICRQPL